MMKALVGLVVAVAFSAGSTALATGSLDAQHDERRDASSVAGRWTLSLVGPHALSMGLVLEQDGTKVTGTLANPHGGGDFPVAGTFADRKLTFSVTSGSDMEFAGALKNDGTLAGEMSSARGDLEWTAKRVSGK